MSAAEIDAYLAEVPEPGRSTLEALRGSILTVVPHAEQCLSYGVPGFRIDGEVVAGFAAAKRHLSYFPHSGEVIAQLADDLVGYSSAKGTLRFALDQPLPDELVTRLIDAKRRLLGQI